MQKTAITGACLHGKAEYQQSQWRWRYLAPYLIGRTRRDYERAQWHRGQPGSERKERGEYQQTTWQRPTRPIAGRHRSARAARRWYIAAYPVILTLSFRVVVQPSAHTGSPHLGRGAAAGLRLTTRLVLRRRAYTRHGSVCVNASSCWHRVPMLSHYRNSLPVPKRRKAGAPLVAYSTSP